MSAAASLEPLLHSRAERVGMLTVAVVLAAVGFLPLFGGPGYEAAVAAGVVLPLGAGVTTAVWTARREVAPYDAYARGLALGALMAAAAMVVVVAHGLRVGFCDFWSGMTLLALGPGMGAMAAGAGGACAGVLAAPRRFATTWAVIFAVALPFTGVIISLWRFYSSPMVFAFDPFFGYFAGPLYDTVIDDGQRLLTYRAGTLASLAAGAVLALHLERAPGRLGVRFVWRGRSALVLLGGLAALTSAGITGAGATLGHYSTAASIREQLGRTLTTERCEVVYDAGIVDRDARLFGEECDAHVRQLERYFAIRGPERVVAYLFANEGQKGRLMGAATTYIAKPWRREVYLQFQRYPHPVLGHELAHVVSGSFAPGPFRVAGPLGGWLPDPGRIEGIAVAAAPDEDEDLTLSEWSRAMLDLELMPPLQNVFRLSFLGENSAKAYTVAGAFVAWFRDTHGAEALRRWYGGEPLESVTGGKGLAALEADWRRSLAKVELDARARAAAQARFDRPAIFGRRCPHVVDRLAGEAHGKLGAGDHRGATEVFQHVLSLDPHHFGARHALAVCSLRAGDEQEARRRYAAIGSDDSLTRLWRASGEEALADLDLAAGRVEAARKRYLALERVLVNSDARRGLSVKANARDDVARKAVVALLIGDPRYGRDWGEAASWLARWSERDPKDGTADYLLGKNFYGQGRFDAAAERLDVALDREIAESEVLAEALRVRLVLACANSDRERAAEVLARYRDVPGIAKARREGTLRFARRCAGTGAEP